MPGRAQPLHLSQPSLYISVYLCPPVSPTCNILLPPPPPLLVCSLSWWEKCPITVFNNASGQSSVSTSSNKLKIENVRQEKEGRKKKEKKRRLQSERMQLHMPTKEVERSRSAGSLDDSTAASSSKASCICRNIHHVLLTEKMLGTCNMQKKKKTMVARKTFLMTMD